MSANLRSVGAAFFSEAQNHSASSGHLLVDGRLVYATSGETLQVFGVHDMPLPRHVATTTFRNSITGIAKKDDVVFLNTWSRGINLVDVSRPQRPSYFDCIPAIGRTTGRLIRLGDHLIVSWRREKLVGLYDISDPRAPALVHELALPDDVEDMAPSDQRVFVANDEAGVAALEIRDGALIETGRWLQDSELEPQTVHVGQRGVYLFCRGGDSDLVVLDRRDPSGVLASIKTGLSSPRLVLDLPARTFLFHSHYTCSVLSDNWEPSTLFRQYYTDDVKRYYEIGAGDEMNESCTCMDEPKAGAFVDGHLITMQDNQLMVWSISEHSALAGAT